MPGVTRIEQLDFFDCRALTIVECGKLEKIGTKAFCDCKSMESINLPSIGIVGGGAFVGCIDLTDVEFGNNLRRIERVAFIQCLSHERISIPLKDGMIADDSVFQDCGNLKYVALVRGVLHETIAVLQLKDWRNGINGKIDSINQIVPYAEGEKARAIMWWIRSILREISHYKTEHERMLDEEVAITLEYFLPAEIVMNSVLPFLALPLYTFEVEQEEDDEEDDDESD